MKEKTLRKEKEKGKIIEENSKKKIVKRKSK